MNFIFYQINIFFKYQIKDALIITNGHHNGISKELGNIIKKEGLLNATKKVKIIGIDKWDLIAGRDILKQNEVNYLQDI